VVPQSSAKDQFYGTVNHINMNTFCAAQRASKILKKKMFMLGLDARINSINFLLFMEKIMFKSYLLKSNDLSPKKNL